MSASKRPAYSGSVLPGAAPISRSSCQRQAGSRRRDEFAGRHYEDKRPRDRYVAESKRLLGVLDRRLADRRWMMGDDYTIADIATFPWVRNLIGFYEAGHLVEIADYVHVTRALEAFVARPAVQSGLAIP